MAESSLRISAVPLTTLGAFMEACLSHPSADIEQIAKFAGFSRSTARKVIPTLESLGIVIRGADAVYRVPLDGVARGMSAEQSESVLRKALIGYRPFEALLEGLSLGEAEPDAVRKARLMLKLSQSEDVKLKALLRLGENLGVLERRDHQLALVAAYEPDAGSSRLAPLSDSDIESEARARLFNARTLGREANNYLDEVDRELLAEALLKYGVDATRSVECAGQAVEDFLRHVASDGGFAAEAKKLSGAGQLANLLHTKGVIHNHQQKLVDAVATVRNAKAHRKDKKTLTPWEVTSFAAFSSLATALTAIRSIHVYINEGRQSL